MRMCHVHVASREAMGKSNLKYFVLRSLECVPGSTGGQVSALAAARRPPPRTSRACRRRASLSETRDMAKLLLLGAFVASANAGALELTKSNFDAEVKNSGKNAFVKVRRHTLHTYNIPIP